MSAPKYFENEGAIVGIIAGSIMSAHARTGIEIRSVYLADDEFWALMRYADCIHPESAPHPVPGQITQIAGARIHHLRDAKLSAQRTP